MSRPTKRPETTLPARPAGEQAMTRALYAAIRSAVRRLVAAPEDHSKRSPTACR